MRIEIARANLRDASFVTANLRAIDREEAFCQLPLDTPSHVLAKWLITAGDGWCAYLDGQPVVLFGTSMINAVTASVWALGTNKMRRAVPAVSAHLLDVQWPALIEQGVTSVEARSLATHETAHRWMLDMGGEVHGPAFEFGRDGAQFYLFRFTVARYRSICEERRRRGKHVHPE